MFMKSVVLCGSTKFKKEMREFAKKLKGNGVVVYEPNLHNATEQEWNTLRTDHQKFIAAGLTLEHFYKIEMADVVFIYNKNGYSGNSVTLEIGFAVAKGKPIYALSDQDEEICRYVLFTEFASSPKELTKYLE